jgi:hypothetical protein
VAALREDLRDELRQLIAKLKYPELELEQR